MMEERLNNDVAKELLTVLAYCDNSFLNNIPENILKNLNDLAADSTKEYYIDENKSLTEQNISDDCKDLLGLMYFMYMTDSSSKSEVLDTWLKNEIDSKGN